MKVPGNAVNKPHRCPRLRSSNKPSQENTISLLRQIFSRRPVLPSTSLRHIRHNRAFPANPPFEFSGMVSGDNNLRFTYGTPASLSHWFVDTGCFQRRTWKTSITDLKKSRSHLLYLMLLLLTFNIFFLLRLNAGRCHMSVVVRQETYNIYEEEMNQYDVSDPKEADDLTVESHELLSSDAARIRQLEGHVMMTTENDKETIAVKHLLMMFQTIYGKLFRDYNEVAVRTNVIQRKMYYLEQKIGRHMELLRALREEIDAGDEDYFYL